MNAIVVGAGPVGCLLAIGLRERRFDVEVYDRIGDPRRSVPASRNAFNLTLSARGLRALGPVLSSHQYVQGVRLGGRVRHHADGSLSAESYGLSSEHHLLSVQRSVLHASLLDAAERAGARIRFGHECLKIDSDRAGATFTGPDGLTEAAGDLLAGCDGVHSVVREELARSGAPALVDERIPHGYVELPLPVAAGSEHPLTLAGRKAATGSLLHALQIWPRGSFLLIAQPNPDETYSATLFLPLEASTANGPSFEDLTSCDTLEAFFRAHFPDLAGCLPRAAGTCAIRPGSLRTRLCRTMHHGRAVLLGDAAHTLLPFYGQGINCGFEDVQVLLELLDQAGPVASGTLHLLLADFSERRRGPCQAIAELSRAWLDELARDGETAVRAELEHALHARHPDAFAPLYFSVAFTTTPYDEAVAEYEARRTRLDEACQRFPVRTSRDAIIEAYLTARRPRESTTARRTDFSCRRASSDRPPGHQHPRDA